MKKLTSSEIRQIWLDFWKSKGHDIIESAPLIPNNDPTLLWINAGVAPLKKYFDGREIPKNRRMANAQKSIRTNDIDNVGRTARHHTFFEMLGNFSIGDYFRDEALTFAYEILTSPKYYGFDLNKLYFTVYPDDTTTIAKWVELGVPRDHIIKVEDNFWEIGEGPCGPDTEIFYDRGVKYDPNNYGIRLIEEDIQNDRYIEIWNIVFSQFNAKAGVDRKNYKELPSKNIDTGMGLERMACVIQEVETNYETDLFMPIIDKCSQILGVEYKGQMAFRVIADHVRSVVFALSDGATFSNEGRGYVLRRLLRRAVRFGRNLGATEPFLYKLVHEVVSIMAGFYRYLIDKEALVTKQIKIEEEKFLMTLESGEKRLLDYINNSQTKVIDKDIAFLLYDTFGFPFELLVEVASEHNFTVDEKGFRELLQLQKERARNARSNKQSMSTQNIDMLNFTDESKFVGYEELETVSKVITIFKDGQRVNEASGDIIAVFDKTGFYAESGGQIGDIGTLTLKQKHFEVTDTVKLPNNQHGLIINMKETELKVNDEVMLAVDEDFRNDVRANHSATHLLNESLRKVVGSHVIQQGSQVSNNVLRFDFNNFTPLTNEEILKVEALVNEEINKAHEVKTLIMPLEEAKKMNVQAVFGEKYQDIVRVIDMDYSRELCGGTHVTNTKDIGKFAILSVESKGSGIFRIEAATRGHINEELDRVLENIAKEINNSQEKINSILEKVKNININYGVANTDISEPVESYQMVINRRLENDLLRNYAKDLEKTYNKLVKEQTSLPLENYLDKIIKVKDYNIAIIQEKEVEVEVVKDLVDRLCDYLPNSLVFIANVLVDKVIFVCKTKISNLDAGKLVKMAAMATNGNGGGRKDFAQAGGKDPSLTSIALEKVKDEVLKNQ